MKLQKIITYLVLLIGAIGAILWFTMNSSINKIMNEGGITEASDLAKNPELFNLAEPAVTPLYALLLVVLAIILVVTLISIFNSLASKPGAFKKVLIPIVLFAIILLIGYMFSTGDNVDLQPFIEKGQNITEATSKKVGAGIISFYVLIALAIGTMIWSGVKKIAS
jgi:glucan phosphoethanolaminetransferase (alkaline phosphatase superfamily)